MSQSTLAVSAAEEQAVVSVTAPASKSVSHRYLIGAALAQGVSTVRHTLESRDLERTRAILCGAGAIMETLPESTQASGAWRVTGMGGKPHGGTAGAPLSCDVEESGTTCRLLTAVLAAGEGEFRIHGAPRMHERPIGELTDALLHLGCSATFEGKPDCPPLVLHANMSTAGWPAGNLTTPADTGWSNQITYTTPSFGGLKANLHYQFGEQAGNSGKSNIGLNVMYFGGPLTLMGFYERADISNPVPPNSLMNRKSDWMLGGAYDFGMAKA